MFMVDYKSPWLVKIVSDKRRNGAAMEMKTGTVVRACL